MKNIDFKRFHASNSLIDSVIKVYIIKSADLFDFANFKQIEKVSKKYYIYFLIRLRRYRYSKSKNGESNVILHS